MSLREQQATSGSPSIVHSGVSISFLVVGVVCLILGGLLASQFGPPAVAFEITALLLCLIFIPLWWPYGALSVLLIASVMPCFSVDLGGWNARPEAFAALLLLIVLLYRKMMGAAEPLALTATDLFVAAYIVWNYVSSAMISPDPKLTLRWALLNNLVILPYFLIRLLVTNQRMLRRAFNAFMAIGVGECAYAVVAFTSWRLLGTSFGVNIDQYASGSSGVYGTQYEPNLLGSYAGCLAIMLLVLYFVNDRRPRWILGGVIVAVAAMLVSLSRAAFLSFGIALILLFIIGLRKGLIRWSKLLPLGLSLVFFLTPVAVTGGKNLAARLANFSESGIQGDADTINRLLEWTVAIEDIWQHPLAGNGTASFQLLANAKEFPILGSRPWVGNSLIRILHDTGMVGLLIFGLMVVTITKQARSVTARGAAGHDIIIALFAGCLVYALAFMSTEGTMLAFFWVHVGLLATACTVLGKHSRAGIQANV